mmetsp:Transcript_71989/g.159303  ORF Transcript_71989/g.159303 Transcript_71989/m.159303 type:complete len:312 (-) Transcript_71989:1110-2045(-)
MTVVRWGMAMPTGRRSRAYRRRPAKVMSAMPWRRQPMGRPIAWRRVPRRRHASPTLRRRPATRATWLWWVGTAGVVPWSPMGRRPWPCPRRTVGRRLGCSRCRNLGAAPVPMRAMLPPRLASMPLLLAALRMVVAAGTAGLARRLWRAPLLPMLPMPCLSILARRSRLSRRLLLQGAIVLLLPCLSLLLLVTQLLGLLFPFPRLLLLLPLPLLLLLLLLGILLLPLLLFLNWHKRRLLLPHFLLLSSTVLVLPAGLILHACCRRFCRCCRCCCRCRCLRVRRLRCGLLAPLAALFRQLLCHWLRWCRCRHR